MTFDVLCDQEKHASNTYAVGYDERAMVVVDEQGIIKRVMKESWGEDYLADLLLFLVKQDTSCATSSQETAQDLSYSKANYNGYNDKHSNFYLPDERGLWHNLSDYRGKWCVLFFPIDQSEQCLTHIGYMSRAYDWLCKQGIGVVGISTLMPEQIACIKERLKIDFPILYDYDKTVGSSYGAYHWCGDTPMTLILDEAGHDKEIIESGNPVRHIIGVLLWGMRKTMTRDVARDGLM